MGLFSNNQNIKIGASDGKNPSDAMTLEEAKAYCFSCHFTPSAMAQDTEQNGRFLCCEERHQFYPKWLGEYYDLVFEKLNTPGENVKLWFYNFCMVWVQMQGDERYRKHLNQLYLFLVGCTSYSADIQFSILYDFFGVCPCYSGFWYISLYKDELPRFMDAIENIIRLLSYSGESEKAKKYKTYLEVWDKYEKYNILTEFVKERKKWEYYL